MYNLLEFNLQELFRLRDACTILMGFGFTLIKDLFYEINQELNEREKPFDPDSPEHERDIPEV